ncbi:MAG: hypothetical protein L6422_05585 [Candidatus Marinimicrobia bacterium]|nr:hypothetical protein [Candidatus Neomarinimicrobiota bacterium]
MINNSSLKKWDRLAQKQLGQQFVNEIIQGLQCSPFEANVILDQWILYQYRWSIWK